MIVIVKRKSFLLRLCLPLALMLSAVAVGGCGQRGPLTLPARPVDLPAVATPQKAPANAADPAPK